MSHSRVLLAAFLVAVGLVACHGGSSVTIPHGGTSGTPTPAPAPSGGATLSPAAVATALLGVQQYYVTLPHTDPVSDIAAVAKQMVSSGAFKTATVTSGGITGTLSDGSPALVFADSPADLGLSPSAHARRPLGTSSGRLRPLVSPATNNEIAFLVNASDSKTFTTATELAWNDAFTNQGFARAGYGIDAASVSLGNIVTLGSGHPIDLLDIATHGMVVGAVAPYNLALLSDTAVNATSKAQYAADLLAHRVMFAIYLTLEDTAETQPVMAFTPDFLAANLHFNRGAIVNLGACWSANPLVAGTVGATLESVGVGRYYGWTKSLSNLDFYETNSFLYDRLLGEQSPTTTHLDAFASQRMPPQRPFPLDDIETAMASETRSSPIQPPQSEPYTVSDKQYAINANQPPVSDGTASKLVVTDFGGAASSLIEYGLPSISQMAVTQETPSGGTLSISGTFPATPGTATITDASGTTPLTVTSWTKNAVTVALPRDGNGSAGTVQVLTGANSGVSIVSNAVPLTQWAGTVTYSENETLSSLGGVSGGGNGSVQVAFNLTFRGDVHPTVPSIDASPVPQNLSFPQVEGNSTAAVTALTGLFTASGGTPPPATASFSLASTPNMTPQNLPLSSSTFIVGALGGQPAPCNNGSPGPEGDAGNVFCPGFGYFGSFVGVCSPDPNDTALCGGYETFAPTGGFGSPTLVDPGIVTLTLDPSSYAITVSGPSTAFTRPFHGSFWRANASVTGTIKAPLYAPTSTAPSGHKRQTASSR
jgi:hypothetical protein